MNPTRLLDARLRSHRLSAPARSATDAARHLLAVQSQDFLAGRWALGVRTSGAPTLRSVDRTFARGALVRDNPGDSQYRGARGLDPEVVAEITHRYGFDKPLLQRYGEMLWNYLRFDFGDSLFRNASVLQLI